MSEPIVEQWMRDAADELGNLDIDDFQREALVECERDEDRANALMLERLAGVIAKHAPDHFADASKMVEPQPIRRGDVVQCIRDCRADEGDGMYAVKDVSVTDGLTPGGRLLLYGRRFDPGSFARIGRARYYPDGTPVEN